MKRSVLIYSGGVDSTVLLYQLLSEGVQVRCMSFNYGQKHFAKEYAAAQSITQALSLQHSMADISAIAPLLGNNALVNKGVDAAAGPFREQEKPNTVVPNRNMMMISIATAAAVSAGCDSVVYGCHAGDAGVYADCRKPFIDALESAILEANPEVTLKAPLIKLQKVDIVRRGMELGVPFEKTWTCYKDGDLQCGVCGACIERQEAFEKSGIVDPAAYQKAWSVIS